jgi:hypothetical protein
LEEVPGNICEKKGDFKPTFAADDLQTQVEERKCVLEKVAVLLLL